MSGVDVASSGELRCVKRSFRNKAAAKRAIGHMQTIHGTTARQVYRCPKCGWWHLTSGQRKSSSENGSRK